MCSSINTHPDSWKQQLVADFTRRARFWVSAPLSAFIDFHANSGTVVIPDDEYIIGVMVRVRVFDWLVHSQCLKRTFDIVSKLV